MTILPLDLIRAEFYLILLKLHFLFSFKLIISILFLWVPIRYNIIWFFYNYTFSMYSRLTLTILHSNSSCTDSSWDTTWKISQKCFAFFVPFLLLPNLSIEISLTRKKLLFFSYFNLLHIVIFSTNPGILSFSGKNKLIELKCQKKHLPEGYSKTYFNLMAFNKLAKNCVRDYSFQQSHAVFHKRAFDSTSTLE